MTFFVELNGNGPDTPGPPVEPPSPEPAPQPQASVGQVLKARRLELGLKHKDVSRDTKIRAEYLKAIEEEEFDLLPTPQYLRLFLKSYAEYLGLDVQEIYGLYDTREIPVKKLEKNESSRENEVPPPPPPAGQPTARGYALVIIVGAVVVLVVAMFLIMAKRNSGPVESEPEPIPIGTATDTTAIVDEGAVSTAPARHQLEMRAFDSTWMVIQADDDTAFNGFLGPGDVRTWAAENVFRFSLSSSANAEARFDGRYLMPFLNWPRPIQGREVGAFNLDQYLDSSRLAGGQ